MTTKPVPRPVIIVQARMTSSRLPGKVLKKVLGRPLLQYLIERLQRCKSTGEVVIATSTDSSDDPIVALCGSLEVPVVRGPLDDVLLRYWMAAKRYEADPVIRICSDCVLIDPEIIDEALEFFLSAPQRYDYVCNFFMRCYPRGFEVEVFTQEALKQAEGKARKADEREHVTPFILRHKELFSHGSVVSDKNLGMHRWVVDTEEDFELVNRVIEKLYPKNPEFSMEDIQQLLGEHPEWVALNANVQQKLVEGMPGGIHDKSVTE